MPQDYYEVLGVSKSASDAEIKSAYRKLAREWHPDVAKDKPNSEEKFKEINEAYQVLSDKSKRAQYDQFGHDAFGGASGGAAGAGGNPFSGFGGFGGNQGPFTWSYSSGGGAQDFDPFDIFEQVFGFRGFGGQRKGRNLNYTLQIDLVEAIKGFEETVQVDGHKLKVKLPAGVADGTRVRFSGKGENPGRGIPAGDLYISIDIKPHPKFARQGNDIFTAEEISMKIAALGGTIDVEVVEPKSSTGFTTKRVKIPEGTQPGTQIRLRGQGMPSSSGYGRGNHYITVRVVIPKKLSKEQKRMLEEYF